MCYNNLSRFNGLGRWKCRRLNFFDIKYSNLRNLGWTIHQNLMSQTHLHAIIRPYCNFWRWFFCLQLAGVQKCWIWHSVFWTWLSMTIFFTWPGMDSSDSQDSQDQQPPELQQDDLRLRLLSLRAGGADLLQRPGRASLFAGLGRFSTGKASLSSID